MRLSLKDTRYRMPKEKRKFGGEIYTYFMTSGNKREAESDAEMWRKKGWKVRITPFGGAYALYYRKAK